MKILHVSQSDGPGGGEEATVRIHRMLVNAPREWAWESFLALRTNTRHEVNSLSLPDEEPLAERRLRRYERVLVDRINDFARSNSNEIISVPRYLETPTPAFISAQKPDLVNLHWVGKNLVSISDLVRLRRPVVWTLHDEWPLSGVRHYKLERSSWADLVHTGKRAPYSVRLLDNLVGAIKGKVIARSIDFIAPSEWMADFALSRGVPEKNLHVIPYPLTREISGRPTAGVLPARVSNGRSARIIFISSGGPEDARKGFEILTAALENLGFENLMGRQVELIVVGGKKSSSPEQIGCVALHFRGFLTQEKVREELENSDLLVHLSVADNFPLVTQEALAVGTPVMVLAGVGNSLELSAIQGVVVVAGYRVEDVSRAIGEFVSQVAKFRALRPSIAETSRRLWAPDTVLKAYRSAYHAMLA